MPFLSVSPRHLRGCVQQNDPSTVLLRAPVTRDTASDPVGDNQFRTNPKRFATLGALQTAAPFQFGHSGQNIVLPALLDQSLKGFDPPRSRMNICTPQGEQM